MKHPIPLAQRAGMLCNDARFRDFVATRLELPTPVNAMAAAHYLRDFCKVGSRRDLDTDSNAAARFDVLRTEFDAWRGRIARPER